MNYVVYQLQAIQSSNRKYELVLARNSACGRIPLQLGRSPDISATESVTGVFLAGGSFLFDLDKEAEHQGKKKYKYSVSAEDRLTHFSTLHHESS